MAELKRILLIEDDPDIQAVARMALEMVGGFEVHICSNGMQAIQEAAGLSPDLILLDVMMPGMDGPTTLGKLKELPALIDVPVVFMTAKVQPGEVSRYKALGAVGVIAKPFDPMALTDQVRDLWETGHGG